MIKACSMKKIKQITPPTAKHNNQHLGNEVKGTQAKPRLSNFELLRLLSMFMVLLIHANFQGVGTVQAAEVQATPLSGFTRTFFGYCCIVCVDVFVLISGWFGIRPKWEAFTKLLFQIAFIFFTIAALTLFFWPASVKDFVWGFLIGSDYWFIVSYIGLYIIAPVLNTFIENVSKQTLLLFLVQFFCFQFLYSVYNDYAHFSSGYSTISFIGLYLLSRYLRLYPNRWTTLPAKCYLCLYAGLCLLAALLTTLTLYYGHGGVVLSVVVGYNYNSPLVISCAVALLLAFNRLKFQNKFINTLAVSALSIYLIQSHPLVRLHYYDFIHQVYEDTVGIVCILAILGISLLMAVFCLSYDQLRLYCWALFSKLLHRL